MNLSSFIWSIADDVLRGVYTRGKYRDIILPMTVIRRLDAVLEPTKAAVLAKKKDLEAKLPAQALESILTNAAGQAFHNQSPFTLRQLLARPNPAAQRADFEAYLDGFSADVRDMVDRFGFRRQLDTLERAGILHALLEKFCDERVNLSPFPVRDGDGRVRLPALDNHAMGTLFEELLRRFNEENNEEAGEHFTPRDVVELMAELVFRPATPRIGNGTYLLYDDACGTGGMLTVGEAKLAQLAKGMGKEVEIHLYGQESNPETYAICKADLLIKGEGAEARNVAPGSTLSADAHGRAGLAFDFMMANPPFGKSWKVDRPDPLEIDRSVDLGRPARHGSGEASALERLWSAWSTNRSTYQCSTGPRDRARPSWRSSHLLVKRCAGCRPERDAPVKSGAILRH